LGSPTTTTKKRKSFVTVSTFVFSQVTAKSDFTDESYSSSWFYLNHREKHAKTTGTDYGHDDYVFHDELFQSQVLYYATTY